MLFVEKLQIQFWAEAAKTVVYLMNKSPSRANLGISLDEVFFRSKPSLIHLRTFSCLVYVHLDKIQRNKLEPKAQQGILFGYDNNSKAY